MRMLPPNKQAMLILRHAVGNASTEPITDGGILAILRSEAGPGSQAILDAYRATPRRRRIRNATRR